MQHVPFTHTLWFAVKITTNDNRVLSSLAIRDAINSAFPGKQSEHKSASLLSVEQDIWMVPLTGMTTAEIQHFLDRGHYTYSAEQQLPIFIHPVSDAIGCDHGC